MTALPPTSAFVNGGVTESQFKQAISDLRDYLATLLATTGSVADAIAALGLATVAVSGAYSDLTGTPTPTPPFSGGTVSGATEFQNVVKFDKQTYGAIQSPSHAATTTLDLSTSNNFEISLQGSAVLLANPTNAFAGQTGTIGCTQDNATPRLLTFGNRFIFPSGAAPVVTAVASAYDFMSYSVRPDLKIILTMMNDVR